MKDGRELYRMRGEPFLMKTNNDNKNNPTSIKLAKEKREGGIILSSTPCCTTVEFLNE